MKNQNDKEAITIQKYVRCWLCKRRFDELLKAKILKVSLIKNFKEDEELRKKDEQFVDRILKGMEMSPEDKKYGIFETPPGKDRYRSKEEPKTCKVIKPPLSPVMYIII